MASSLTKRDYERVLSAEYGTPVFLTDKEFTRIQGERPNPEIRHSGYQDPSAHVQHKAGPPSDEERAARWTTQPGTSYNKDHGRTPESIAAAKRYSGFEGDAPAKPGVNASHAAARYSGFEGDAPASPGMVATSAPFQAAPTSIGKIAPSMPSDADYSTKMTYQAPPKAPAVAPNAPIPTATLADLGPVAGQVAAMPAPGAPAPAQGTHEAEMAELDKINAHYAALGGY